MNQESVHDCQLGELSLPDLVAVQRRLIDDVYTRIFYEEVGKSLFLSSGDTSGSGEMTPEYLQNNEF